MNKKMSQFEKYPGMKIGVFKRSDGNGGSKFDVNSIIEKAISGLLIVLCTTGLNWYITTQHLDWRMSRLESAVNTLGKYVWSHVTTNPNLPCPFDNFNSEDSKKN